MVNEIVYTYLKNYKNKYAIADLKKEILSKGYSEVEFNEALSKANSDVEKRIEIGPVKKLPTFYSVNEKKRKNLTLVWIIVFIIFFNVGLFILLNYLGFGFFGFNLFD